VPPSDSRHFQPCIQPVASQNEEQREVQDLSSAQITVVRWSGAPTRTGHYFGLRRDEMRLLTGVKELAKIKRATKDKARRLTW
jgi:hypothetical protein